jgi:hypothetical protein
MQTKSTHSITNVRQSQFVFGARALSTTSWAACHAMTFFQSSIRTSPACWVLSRSPKNNGPKGHQCQLCVPYHGNMQPTCRRRALQVIFSPVTAVFSCAASADQGSRQMMKAKFPHPKTISASGRGRRRMANRRGLLVRVRPAPPPSRDPCSKAQLAIESALLANFRLERSGRSLTSSPRLIRPRRSSQLPQPRWREDPPFLRRNGRVCRLPRQRLPPLNQKTHSLREAGHQIRPRS